MTLQDSITFGAEDVATYSKGIVDNIEMSLTELKKDSSSLG